MSRELWDKTNDILNKRRGSHTRSNGKRDKYSRQYSFSCMLKCGFCGGNLTRRTWNSQTDYKKVIWQCVTATKQGKKECPYCKGVPEALIEEAFVRAYNALCTYDGEFINGFLEYVKAGLQNNDTDRELKNLNKKIVDCQHFFRQIFLGYFPDIVQAFDTLGRNVYGDDYTSLHNPIVLSSVLLVYGMFHSTRILF